MNHLFFLFWVTALLLGFISQILFLLQYFKEKDKLFLSYFLFLFCFGMNFLIDTISIYININIPSHSLVQYSLWVRYLTNIGGLGTCFFIIRTQARLHKAFPHWLMNLTSLLLIILFMVQNGLYIFLHEASEILEWGRLLLLAAYIIIFLVSSISRFTYRGKRFRLFFHSLYYLYTAFLLFIIMDLFEDRAPLFYRRLPESFDFILIFYGSICLFSILGGIILSMGKGPITFTLDMNKLKAFHISPREEQVIGLILSGQSNRKIADKLHISEGTVKTHVNNIFKKVDVSSRMELAAVLSS